jgi:hypothetical protein
MRAGLLLTQFFALFGTVTAAVLSLAAAEREFDLPSGPQQSVGVVVPRCYTLAIKGDSTVTSYFPWPNRIQLTAKPDEASAQYERGWYEVAVAAKDTITTRLGYYMHAPRWRPAGLDSLDITLPGWPIVTRMRIPDHDQFAEGRLIAQGDSWQVLPFNGSWHIINWPAVRTVRAVRTSCDRSGPSNER